MINWLRKNKDSLSLRGIERQLKMPDTTLVKAVNGSQNLPKKWKEPLNKFINKIYDSWSEAKNKNSDNAG